MDGEDDGSVCLATATTSPGRRMHFSWGLGNSLHLCDVAISPTPTTPPGADGGGAGCKHTVVKWGWQSASDRRLCYDCIAPWRDVQKRRTLGQTSGAAWAAQVAEYSRIVGAVLGSRDDGGIPAGRARSDDDLAVALRRIVWELLDVFFVTRTALEQVHKFVGWLQSNSQVMTGFERGVTPVGTMVDEVSAMDIPEVEDSYWKATLLLVALGLTEPAIDLLGMHSAWMRWQNKDAAAAAQFEVLESLITLLQKMPRLSGSESLSQHSGRAFTSVNEFSNYRAKWVGACTQFLRNERLWQNCAQNSPETVAWVKKILGVLVGDETVLEEATRTWSELLCAQLIHCYPSINSMSELCSLSEYCIEKIPSQSAVVVDLVLAILKDEVQEVVSLCSRSMGPWFMAHCGDLFDAAEEGPSYVGLRKPIAGRLGNQFEFFVLDFAEALMTNVSTWSSVCEYLAWCPTCGENALRVFLSGLPIVYDDDTMVMQALDIADKHGMPAVAAKLCRVVGMQRWHEGQLGSAVAWLKRGHDERCLKHLAQEIFEWIQGMLLQDDGGAARSFDEASMRDMLSFANETSASDDDGSLAMLHHLQIFQSKLSDALNAHTKEDAYASGVEAKSAVLHLIGPRTPKKLWLAIIYRAVPLLEFAQCLFDFDETMMLMERLHDVTLAYDSDAILKDYTSEEAKQSKLDASRLALTNNLSRCVLSSTPTSIDVNMGV